MSKLISVSKNANPNYLAKVVLMPPVRDVKGLDNIGVITIDGRDILTQKTANVGGVHVYFPSGSSLNHDFLSKNNDYSDANMNADPLNKGYFDKNGRVKPLKLKGVVSDGYVVPISTLAVLVGSKYLELDTHVGEEFDTLGDILLLKKFIKPVPQQSVPGEKKSRDKNIKKHASRVVEEQFRFHYDTTHLDKNLHRIQPEDLISVSWKLHGTSFISSKVLCRREPKWYERAVSWVCRVLGGQWTKDWYEYGNLYSSRSVIKNEYLNKGGASYYDTDVYKEANKLVEDQLIEGETVYGEIVGFTKSGAAIQGQYDYGCLPGEFNLYIYRITRTSQKGNVIDLPYKLMEQRCEQMGLTPVPLIFQGRARDLVPMEHVLTKLEVWQEQFINELKKSYIGGKSRFCMNNVPEEGIVIRVEGLKAFALKLVSPDYKLKESKAKDEGVVDMEEEQEAIANGTE